MASSGFNHVVERVFQINEGYDSRSHSIPDNSKSDQSVGLEYPAVVEFAPFQKIAKKKLKKKDAKTKSLGSDTEYKKLLEIYCMEEEKTSTDPKTLLGDIEAKTGLISLFRPFLPFTSLSVYL